jgi:lipoprotein-anchoring transpeptidase ErfK/SrfK
MGRPDRTPLLARSLLTLALALVASLVLGPAAPAGAAAGDVYFLQGEQLLPVQRPVTTPQDALTALLTGPTPAEKATGVRSYVPAGTPLRSLTIADGVATVDLGELFIKGTNGESLDARVTQVVYTLTATPDVTGVRLLIKGGTPLGIFPGINATAALTRAGLATPSLPAPKPPTLAPAPPPTTATKDLQLRLVELGYLPADAADGEAGPQTTNAVLAFQKWQGLGRDGQTGPTTLAALSKATRPVPISKGGSGRRIEILLDRQVALAIQDNRVIRTIAVSSGAPATPTPPGSYTVFGRYPRWWSVPFQDWLPWSLQFVGGIALHEYPSVPVTPASHGCVRQTRYDAKWLFDFAPLGTPVRVIASSR